MTRLEIRDIYKNFYSVELFYIKADQDGNESIWRKCTKVTNDEEKVLCDRFYHDASFRPELDTPEKIHAYLVDFLHKIEESRKQDIDEDDNTIITFTDDDQEKEADMADTRWYAVQETREDAWDNGSDNYETAVSMLEAQGHGLIAVINEDSGVCEEEITYEELF